MEYKELKKKSQTELNKILAEEREKLRDLRFKDANKQLKDVRLIRKTRVTIAQIITLLNNKKTEQQEESEIAGKAQNLRNEKEKKKKKADNNKETN